MNGTSNASSHLQSPTSATPTVMGPHITHGRIGKYGHLLCKLVMFHVRLTLSLVLSNLLDQHWELGLNKNTLFESQIVCCFFYESHG